MADGKFAELHWGKKKREGERKGGNMLNKNIYTFSNLKTGKLVICKALFFALQQENVPQNKDRSFVFFSLFASV